MATTKEIITMNKTELIALVAEKSGLSKKDAESAVSATTEAIAETLAKDEKIQLIGFGSFEVKHREARMGRNPKTNEAMEIPAAKVPVFKAGKALKDQVDA
ncbi:MAG: HU family DNA-binding protein [Eubacteriales bacterium]